MAGLRACLLLGWLAVAVATAGCGGGGGGGTPATPPPPADTVAPTAPSALSLVERTTSSIEFSWTAATDNVAVTGYEVLRAGQVVGTTDANTRRFVDSGLAASTDYSYAVRARDAAGLWSPQSAALSVSTAAVTPTGPVAAPLAFDEQPFGALTLVDEIDTATAPPAHQYPSSASAVTTLLGRSARVMPAGATAAVMTYRIGQGKGLVAKAAYVLEVEYPDDVPRAIFIANRGSDMLRGFATGTAVGDARKAFTLSTLESLAYPHSGQWKSHRSLFFLHERFSPTAQRNAICATRPLLPADGFDVSVFQTRQLNDPRAQGAAVGKIKLYRVNNAAGLSAAVNYPPQPLPRRQIFWREEMADEAVSNGHATKRAVTEAIDWFRFKMDLGLALGFNAVGKDLMEWGWNQGFDGGDSRWILNAQPPLTNIWAAIVAEAQARQLRLVPYLEYGGSLGADCQAGAAQCVKTAGNFKSLGFQRRTRKLFHGMYGPSTSNSAKDAYTSVWWTEDKSADLTDPDTLSDLKQVLDKVVVQYKGQASFGGVWLRMRQSKLPMSFSAETLARYNAARPNEPRTLAQLQSDVASRQAYYDWWYEQRRAFLTAVRDHVRTGLGDNTVQVIFTAYASEPTPDAYDSATAANSVNLVTDDPAWWSSYTASLNNTTDPKNWYRYKWNARSSSAAVSQRMHLAGLSKTWVPSENPYTRDWFEDTHATPPADPQRYSAVDGVAMSLQFGNALYTVSDPDLLSSYSNAQGQSVVHHFPLNEDNGNAYSEAYDVNKCTDANRYAVTDDEPFDGKVGYLSVAVERAGPFSVLAEARALAHGNPVNLAYLESSSMSRGFPAYVRRFNQALLSLPAVPVTATTGMVTGTEAVVRKFSTSQGTYYAVVNPTLQPLPGVVVSFGSGVTSVQDLLAGRSYAANQLQFDLYPGEVRTFRIP